MLPLSWVHSKFLICSNKLFNEYLLLVSACNILIITKDIKQIKNKASMCSSNLTLIGLALNSDLVILNVSSILVSPL